MTDQELIEQEPIILTVWGAFSLEEFQEIEERLQRLPVITAILPSLQNDGSGTD
jgi:hypothetical protein